MYIYTYIHIYIYTYIHIYIYIYIYIHHIEKKTFGINDKIPPSTKKNTLPKQRCRNSRAPELSVESGMSFFPKNFRTGETNRSSTSSLSPPGETNISHRKGSLGKSSTPKCPFFGGDMLVSWRVRKPQKKKCFNSMIRKRIVQPQFFHLLGAQFLLRFHQNGRQITQLQRRDEKKVMTSKVDSDQTEDTVSIRPRTP